MFTGSGMPMRFADTDGSLIDVYQAATQITDESDARPSRRTSPRCSASALGPQGYYGVFTVNMHTDRLSCGSRRDRRNAAQARGVPVVSAAQMLNWLDARNGSSLSAP